ncbi:MAG: P-II family nitrogen regulator [Thermodesulfovibrionales bacterium]
MQKITAVIRLERFEEVRTALEKKGYPGMMLTRIEGHGQQKGLTQQFRGRPYTIEMLPKFKLELVVKDGDVKDIVATIMGAARTGQTGDGKIFVSPVSEVYRIRTGEASEAAL